jgi:hypothetical protein
MKPTLSAEVIELLARIPPEVLFGQAEDRFASQFGSASMVANLPEADYDRMVKLFSAGYTQGWAEAQTSLLLAILEAGHSIAKVAE